MHWHTTRVLLTGGGGFLGRHVYRTLLARGVPESNIFVPRRRDFDLRRREECDRVFATSFEGDAPDMVIHCAGRVGGLGANKAKPAEFFHDNMAMALHLVEAATHAGVLGKRDGGQGGGKFVMVGSMTSYPASAPVPFKEDDLFNGYPDAPSAPYGLAKLAALEMLRAYHQQYGVQCAYVVPVNLYGPGDNLDPATSHFVGALVDRCVRAHLERAPVLECWGSGSPTRDFLYVEDAAEGVVRAAEVMDKPVPINLGSGREHAIKEAVELIVRLVGYQGEVRWDASKPDGVGRRCVDVTRAAKLLGWRARIGLEEGLRRTIEWRLGMGSHRAS